MIASEEERILGLEVFFTNLSGIGGKLKVEPEDFQVEELSLAPKSTTGGKYTLAKIRARNWETNKLVKALARALGISRKRIYFAGTKDKRAITTRMFGFEAPKEQISKLKVPEVEILESYSAARALELGELLGNKFEIRVRNPKTPFEETKRRVEQIKAQVLANGGYPNFYGVQRFGAVRPITHLVGKHIIKGNFEDAAMTYVATPLESEPEEARSARKFLQESYDFKKALQLYPRSLGFELAIIHYLAKYPNDWVNALRQLPKNLLCMFIHSYQSYIFNKLLSERMRRRLPLNEALLGDLILPIDKNNLPLHNSWIKVEARNISKLNEKLKEGKAFVSGIIFGAESEFAEGVQGEIEHRIIEEEKLVPENFIVPKIPELSSRGERRNLLAPLHTLECKVSENSIELKFQLQKGCYATSLLREFMKSSSLTDY